MEEAKKKYITSIEYEGKSFHGQFREAIGHYFSSTRAGPLFKENKKCGL